MKEKFGFVQANYTETIKISDSKNNITNSTIYEMPKDFKKKEFINRI